MAHLNDIEGFTLECPAGSFDVKTRMNYFSAYDSFLTYTAVLLAKRFLLNGQCLKLLADRDVRVSHKLLAMSCLSHLALYLPKFLDIPLQAKGDNCM